MQGFGEKTDLSTGRVLNLDASYDVIKEAVEEAGLRCVRADKIIHSGTIDEPMYEWLDRADLVVADLSTYNVNAACELGVRYGLRPSTTMIVAENQFKNPFDVGQTLSRSPTNISERMSGGRRTLASRRLRISVDGGTPSGDRVGDERIQPHVGRRARRCFKETRGLCARSRDYSACCSRRIASSTRAERVPAPACSPAFLNNSATRR
jgi:hypothetical protein